LASVKGQDMTRDETATEKPRGRRPTNQGEARLQALADYVLSHGSASAQDLATEFDVSLMTIHRDLDKLEAQGIVRKHHGGVSAQPSGIFESNIAYRRQAMRQQKADIAARAATLIEPGMSIMLDDSTSVQYMLKYLPDLAPLHVATNFLDGMLELGGTPGIELIGLGGDYDDQHRSFLGVGCMDAIRSLRVDAVFVSTAAVDGQLAFHQEQRIVSVKRAMLEIATKRYLLLDHTKLGKTALHTIAPMTDFDLVIVDEDTPDDALRDLTRNGVRYVVAPRLSRRGTSTSSGEHPSTPTHDSHPIDTE
jgi:DeoR/GlpR family transcriptional regulator of sugar metabolism